MRIAAKAFDNVEGFEEQLANLKVDIEVQQNKSNQEGDTSREDQATSLLQPVTHKNKQKRLFKHNM
eukprot:1451629-Heterocapsa_arctica.AAC.1